MAAAQEHNLHSAVLAALLLGSNPKLSAVRWQQLLFDDRLTTP